MNRFVVFVVFICSILKINSFDQNTANSINNQFDNLPKDINQLINELLDLNSLTKRIQLNKSNNKKTKKSSCFVLKSYEKAIFTENTTKLYEILSSNFTFINEKLEANIKDNLNLWRIAFDKNDLRLLKQIKQSEIKMKLSNDELFKIIETFKSNDYYETFEFLLDYLEIDDNETNKNLLIRALTYLKTAINTHEQTSQMNIVVRILANMYSKSSQSVFTYFQNHFDLFIYTLNYYLVDFLLKEYKIDINKLVDGLTNLQWVVFHITYDPNFNLELAYKMIDFLLTIHVDIKKLDGDGNDIFAWVDKITEPKIRQIIHSKLLKYQNKQ